MLGFTAIKFQQFPSLKWRIRINDPKLILRIRFSNTKNYTSPPVFHLLNFGRNPFFLLKVNLYLRKFVKQF